MATDGSITRLITLLKQGDRAAVVAGLTTSREADTLVVADLYETYLRRPGVSEESVAWVNYLHSTGNKNFLVNQFLISGEYYNGSTTW